MEESLKGNLGKPEQLVSRLSKGLTLRHWGTLVIAWGQGS